MKLYTEQQLREAMKTIALHVYDKRESNDSNTTFTINILINNLEPHHSVEANETISDEKISIAAKEYDMSGLDIKKWEAKLIFIDAVKWYQQQLIRKS